MPIRVLDPRTASQIAAGEVVERPASVVKELMENSLDAGASEIVVELQDGGLRSIRVSDNGSGIPSDEVALAFQRHATSKIASGEDLESIETLGFRGEALPSIVAVASVALTTRPHEDSAGRCVKLADGRVIEEGPAGCPPGTSVTVTRLFASVPARRKFLRSANAERTRIGEMVSRFAMAFPHVRFRLLSEGRESLASPGTGDLLEVLAAVYGIGVAQELLPVEGEDDGYVVTGFVSPPSLSRANRSHVTFLVNRRWVQSRLLSVALEQAYHGLLQQGRHPVAALNLILPVQQVDVNVHPTKREVRFRREDRAFSTVQRAVRSVLVAHSPVPELATETPRPSVSFPVARSGPTQSVDEARQERLIPREALPRLRVLGQMGNTYLVAEGPDGLYLIDQHAAHERVLFEQVRERAEEGASGFQSLLEPVPVELTYTQAEMVRENGPLLERYGFVLEQFGERTYLIRGVPSAVAGSEPAQALREVLDLISTDFRLMEREEALAASIACHAAVRAGRSMTPQEMDELARQLEATGSPNTCPHGRPTMVRLSSQHLEREFGRR